MSANTTPNDPATSSKDLRMHATAIARPRIVRARRLACRLAALAALGVGALGVSAAPALAGDCPNEQLRSENNSTQLPECRAYETWAPSYTEGFGLFPQAFSDDGAVTFSSPGNFAGSTLGTLENQYIATRSASGWTTTSQDPSAVIYESHSEGPVEALSSDLRSSLWNSRRGEPPADVVDNFYVRGPDGSMTRVGPNPVPGVNAATTVEASEDLTHILYREGGSAVDSELYEQILTGNEGPPLPVGVDNNGNQLPLDPCPAGIPSSAAQRQKRGMSTDGRVIVFNSGCLIGVLQLWARVGESATVAVSGSDCTRTSGDPGGACNALAPAEFEGMASDGSRVFFTTSQQLVNGDTDQTSDLYECDIPPGAPAPVGSANPCASLTEVSHGVTGANVESVVNVSEDGSRVYFIAQGALAANLGTNDAPAVAGDHNLYVWERDAAHPAGQTTFVANLASGGIELPSFEAQSTADGRYFVFATASRLLTSDTDEAPDVYRYDAQTGALLRLSTDLSGTGGNEPGFEARLAYSHTTQFLAPEPRLASMTSDGSIVVFETSEALTPTDTNGGASVYAWHDGKISLISLGGGLIGITHSGQDIFFGYSDARIDGGFPVTASAPCSGEACLGAAPPQPQSPGTSASAAFSGPGSPLTAEAPPAGQPKPKPQTAAQKLAKALKACKTRHDKKKRKACEKKARNTYRRGK